MVADGQQMRQQPSTVGPARDLPAVVGEHRPHQPDRRLRWRGFSLGSEPSPNDGLHQAVNTDRVRAQLDQRVGAQRGQHTVVGQPIGHHRRQLLGQDFGAFRGQGAGDVGGQEPAQFQQCLRDGGLGADPVQRHRPHRRYTPLGRLRPRHLGQCARVESEELARPLPQQAEVGLHPGAGLFEIGSGLLQRERQVPDQLRHLAQ